MTDEAAKKNKKAWSSQTDQPLPEPSFKVHVSALASQALLHLGIFPHPATGETSRNLDQARFVIEMIAMLEIKTAGNLDEAEQAFVSHMVRDLREKLAAAANPS